MSTLMNEEVCNTTTEPARADDLAQKIYAHWDSTVNLSLCDTMPMQIIDVERPTVVTAA